MIKRCASRGAYTCKRVQWVYLFFIYFLQSNWLYTSLSRNVKSSSICTGFKSHKWLNTNNFLLKIRCKVTECRIVCRLGLYVDPSQSFLADKSTAMGTALLNNLTNISTCNNWSEYHHAKTTDRVCISTNRPVIPRLLVIFLRPIRQNSRMCYETTPPFPSIYMTRKHFIIRIHKTYAVDRRC